MLKIELKTEFGAHEITATDFDGEKRPDIKGVIWRVETRTVRLKSPQEEIDLDEDAEEGNGDRKLSLGQKPLGLQRVSKFYGIGCFIITKNGRAIEIMSPKAFADKYRYTS